MSDVLLTLYCAAADGELIADATAQQILMTFDRWPAERAAIEAMAGGARQAREA